MSERDPRDRDPFDNLRDLIDEPVAPRTAFADELRSRLMHEMSASNASREEHSQPMDAVLAPRPPLAFPIASPRRIRPMVILELAAVAIIVIGMAAALSRGWFGNDPEPPTSVPAAALQGDQTPNPEPTMMPTEASAPLATPAPDSNSMIPTQSPDGGLQLTAVPPGNMDGTIWVLPGTVDEPLDFGGMVIHDGTIYRLLATPSFVGVQAVDAESGAVEWQQTHRWAGQLFVIEDGVLYFDGGGNTLTAVNAETGAEIWRASISGDPRAVTVDGDRVFVLLNNDMVTALDAETGDQLWVAQGSDPQNASGGSASGSADHLIAVQGNTVAAIATNGMLSGFDVTTGEELWSHEGYEAATSSIQTEDGRFIVIDAVGIWVDGEEIDPMTQTGTPEAGVQVATSGTSSVTDCAGAFVEAGSVTSSQSESASVEAGSVTSSQSGTASVESGAVTADTFRVQAIDPVTGEILWDRQSIPDIAAASSGAPSAQSPGTICAIEAESGDVVSISSNEANNANTVEIGSISGGTFVAGELDDQSVVSSAIGNVSQSADNPIIFAVSQDNFAYLQFMDGTLMKVAAGQMDAHVGNASPEPASDN